MDKVKTLLTKYALYILVVGIVLIIIATTWLNNLPSPYMMYPGEYTPRPIANFLLTVGILISLLGAFVVIRNVMAIKNSTPVDTDKITKAIAEGFSNVQSQNPGTGYSGAQPQRPQYTRPQTPGAQFVNTNVAVGGVVVAPSGEVNVRSEVFEVKKMMTSNGINYVFVDVNNEQIVGINSILNHLTAKGYRIISTLESRVGSQTIMQIVVEK